MQNTESRNWIVGAWVFGLLAGAFSVGCARPRREAPPAPAASASAASPAAEAARESEELIVTSLPSLPGRKITQDKGGFYCRYFEYSGTGDYGERMRKALDGIRSEGNKLGANAFVHAMVSSESHEIQGSKWHSSFVHICGDFVVVE